MAHPLKADFLRELGYAGPLALIDPLLEAAGLSSAKKPRIHPDKREAVAQLIEARLVLACGRGDCQAAACAAAGERIVALSAGPEHCEICGGSVNAAAVERMIEACRGAGWRRLVVVGGSPNARSELERLVGGRLELRLIDGTRARSARLARGDLAWADRIVVWGATQLDHKVSTLYDGPKKVQIAIRSVKGVAEAVAESARRQGRG
ncbi:MAG: hypothetical protein H6811_02095 [Phycisphaeraceae bacterium]|nr:hypothetical protein [Phycisphaeraceae bacterium]